MENSKLFVTGASGLIGSEVCRLAVAMGHEVLGLSLHGAPAPEEPWHRGVTWIEGDVLDPEPWRALLDGCEALVHCVGVGNAQFDDADAADRILGDAPVTAWREAKRAGVEKFVFLSTSTRLPFASREYLDAKMRAEATIAAGELPYAFLRPGLVWGPQRPLGKATERLLSIVTESKLPGASTLERARPLRVERVAMAALRAALEDTIDGVLEHEEIEHIGDAMMIQ